MKPGVIIGFTFLILVVLLMGKCSYSVYTEFKEFPEYAKKEVLHVKYKDLLKSIDETLEKSDSFLSFAANLEKIEKPDDLIYFALKKNETKKGFEKNDIVDIVKKFEGGGSFNKTLINGAGYGTVEKQNILIIEYSINKYDVEDCIMYFKDAHPRPDLE